MLPIVCAKGKIKVKSSKSATVYPVNTRIEDLKWVMKNMKKLDKIAVVSDSNVWKWLVALDSPFAQLIGISEKHFELSELNDAWDWVKH